MRILLDTHVLLWLLEGNRRVKPISAMILNPANDVFFSVVCLWEVAIKHRIGKLEVSPDMAYDAAVGSGFEELPITSTHVKSLSAIDPTHRDPFDRMLAAQSIAEPMRLVTADQNLARIAPLVDLIK